MTLFWIGFLVVYLLSVLVVGPVAGRARYSPFARVLAITPGVNTLIVVFAGLVVLWNYLLHGSSE